MLFIHGSGIPSTNRKALSEGQPDSQEIHLVPLLPHLWWESHLWWEHMVEKTCAFELEEVVPRGGTESTHFYQTDRQVGF